MNTPKSKKILLVFTLLIALVMLAGCAATNTATPSAQTTAAPAATGAMAETAQPTAGAIATVTLPTFTAETLATYNGQNGNPAYIAVNGKVYDVTDVPQWKNGSHFGRFQAGMDLTDSLKLSPHGPSKLDTVPVVGLYQAK